MNEPQSNPNEALLRNVLERVADGELSVDEALPQVQLLTGSASATIQNFATLLRPAMQRQAAAAGWIVGGVFAAIGTIFFLVGAGFAWRSVQFLDAAQADGVIVRMVTGKPVAKYEVNQKPFEVMGTISSKPPAFNVGDKVVVLYKPDDPSNAQIDGFVERWLFPVIFGGLGAVFGLVGWGLLLFRILKRLFAARPQSLDAAERFTIE